MAMLTVHTINGSLADNTANDKYLTIVQSELERSNGGLQNIPQKRELLPINTDQMTTEQVKLNEALSLVNSDGDEVGKVTLDTEHIFYNIENVLDHIVVVTNTGNIDGYIRTWFAFEMGQLLPQEFEKVLKLNQNTDDWEWESFKYNVTIDGGNYAVVCAKHKGAIVGGATTKPSLLQLYLDGSSGNGIPLHKIDSDADGLYTVRAYSQVVSDDGAWGAIKKPWNME